jgi:branched-chain amino acid transport system ATP-binding protein
MSAAEERQEPRAEQAGTPAIEARGLTATYGPVTALHGIDLVLRVGSVCALIGPNGAGKTTTLRALGGQKRYRGTVTFNGRDISNWRPHRIAGAGFAQVPQGRRMFADLTVTDNLLLGAWGRSRAEREKSLAEAHEMFPRLRERSGQRAGSLSGGEQQMVAIARALMRGPSVIAMDEPSLGLAPIIVKEVFDTIRRIRDSGVSVLLVEQNAVQALAVSDYVYVLNGGRIAYEGPSDAAARELDLVHAYLR